MSISRRSYTVADLIEYEQLGCRPKSELTFKLIGLSHYLNSNATWKSSQNEQWSIPRLIREELAQPVIGAACGGTHRMMGFSYAVRVREDRGEPINGEWLRAKQYVDSYHDYTFRLQNPDGSFSTRWFEGRGNESDIQRKMQTTGHILEWMVFSLPADRLHDDRVTRSVDFLVDLMLENSNLRWEVGPKGHALRALVLYRERTSETSTPRRVAGHRSRSRGAR